MKPRHPIACLDTRPTPDAIHARDSRRTLGLSLLGVVVFALAVITALAARQGVLSP